MKNIFKHTKCKLEITISLIVNSINPFYFLGFLNNMFPVN